MELGILLPPGMLGSRTGILLRKTQGYGIPHFSALLFSLNWASEAELSTLGTRFHPLPQSPCVSCSFHLQYLPSPTTQMIRDQLLELVPRMVCGTNATQGTAPWGKGWGEGGAP